MYVYVTGTGSGTGSGIPVPVVFFDRNRTSPTFFYEKKKGVEQEFLWKSCSLRGHQMHMSSHIKTTGASLALLGAYLKISA
jgi:hypothetical protein